jgi:hypothetical protein
MHRDDHATCIQPRNKHVSSIWFQSCGSGKWMSYDLQCVDKASLDHYGVWWPCMWFICFFLFNYMIFFLTNDIMPFSYMLMIAHCMPFSEGQIFAPALGFLIINKQYFIHLYLALLFWAITELNKPIDWYNNNKALIPNKLG